MVYIVTAVWGCGGLVKDATTMYIMSYGKENDGCGKDQSWTCRGSVLCAGRDANRTPPEYRMCNMEVPADSRP
jgi:hypothetical protein